ncbi:hypothetical protein JST97_02430 [bacterium]|nr:hypothetical protein [bacterium]
MKNFILALLLLQWAWAQPAADPSVRHASETDKAPIFGFMINARLAEMRGNSLRGLYSQCILPGLLCGLLFPIYFRLSRREQIGREPTF